MNLPETLLKNPHFVRYYRTWQKNQLSLVFVPMAQICREQGLLEEAREICEEGLGYHPESVSGRLMLARVFYDMDRLSEAEDLVRGILQVLPVQSEAKSLLEKICRCRGGNKPQSGVEGEAPTALPMEGATRAPVITLWENLTMARIYFDQGEKGIAKDIVKKILAREPENLVAQEMWGELNS